MGFFDYGRCGGGYRSPFESGQLDPAVTQAAVHGALGQKDNGFCSSFSTNMAFNRYWHGSFYYFFIIHNLLQ